MTRAGDACQARAGRPVSGRHAGDGGGHREADSVVSVPLRQDPWPHFSYMREEQAIRWCVNGT